MIGRKKKPKLKSMNIGTQFQIENVFGKTLEVGYRKPSGQTGSVDVMLGKNMRFHIGDPENELTPTEERGLKAWLKRRLRRR